MNDDPFAEYGPPLEFPKPPPRRVTLDELEQLLNSESDVPITILPNGEVRELTEAEIAERPKIKVITMRENLGGEYAFA